MATLALPAASRSAQGRRGRPRGDGAGPPEKSGRRLPANGLQEGRGQDSGEGHRASAAPKSAAATVLRALRRRDLGTVLVAGLQGQSKTGRSRSKRRGRSIPAVTLDPDTKTPGDRGGVEAAAKTPSGTARRLPRRHRPPDERRQDGREQRRALARALRRGARCGRPCRSTVEYDGQETIAKVVLRYRGSGMTGIQSHQDEEGRKELAGDGALR